MYKHSTLCKIKFFDNLRRFLLMLAILSMVSVSYAQTTANRYVDVNASSGGDGSSWASAHNDLQTAINSSTNGHVIFVKKGEYLLTAAISPKEGMEIYGSFTGTETTLAERDLSNFSNDASNATILKSNGNQRVITINYPPVDPSPNILDGLVITGGGNVEQGGGIYVLNASPTLRNLIITDNTASGSNGSGYQNGSNGHGGGIYIVGDCAPTLTNVVFSKNTAKGGNGGNWDGEPYTGGNGGNGYGGGMYSGNTSAPSLINVIFMDNSSNGGLAGIGALWNGDIGNAHGGGMYNANSSAPSLTNVTLSGNKADGATSYGGGIYNEAAPQPKLYNTILLGNTATTNPGIHNESALPDIQYSLIQGETGGSNGNLDGTAYVNTDIFIDPANGVYALKSNSPAINAGSNDLYTNAVGDLNNDFDLAGNQRLYDGTSSTDVIDMGAYELQREPKESISPDANNILYVNKNVSGGDESGNSWENAIPELADAMLRAKENYDDTWATTPLKIYVAKGTYKPLYSPEDGANFGTDQGRDNSFSMVKNVMLYGGFDPANDIIDLTDTRILPFSDETAGTILSGDIGTADDATDNIYNVLVSAGDLGSASIDGFSITAGYANAYSDLYVNGKQIFKCSGAGVYNSVSSPNYKHITLHNNSCTESGGGMFSYMSSPALQLVILKNNQAKDGGGITNQESSSPTLLNVSIQSNNASENGSGMYNVDESAPTLTNVSIVGNEASVSSEEVPSCVSQNSSLTLNNCIIWDVVTGDYTAQNSLIKGTSDTSNGNLDATDLTDTDIFTDPANEDYSLKSTSIAVNTGSNTLYTDAGGDLDNDVDLAGNARLYNTEIIDLGAYEYGDYTAPVFTSSTAVNFAENETGTAYTATATDTNPITYSLGSATDEALFDIVASTGVVTFKTTPDFENPMDADANNSYVILVIASDGINATNQDVTITVTDVDDTEDEDDIDEVVTSVDNQVAIPELGLYPNPTNHELNIDLSNFAGMNVSLSIVNLSGTQYFYKENIDVQLFAINVEQYVAGVYLLMLKTADHVVSRRVIIKP
ncbi:T9SS type A sorting domain-containing protein [Reichenbachiella agarivorans]|uniref:T9SS type A sorting domain-containing protein n=1 Tax=Reichenbachiella agarivorans TaxID=2979464 RepID=A0ABY6CQ55_9BACT|nr:choice-of-anchor Q domain-containing protein [Reichenbachiella agarivorans]UXP31568.1 T9SS type A sorting domain-containing protein [Reichenbachiella agarivorans]